MEAVLSRPLFWYIGLHAQCIHHVWHDGVIQWKPVNSPRTGPVTRSFDVFFDLCLNKRLSEQSWGWWFETPPRSLWRHCNEVFMLFSHHFGIFVARWERYLDNIDFLKIGQFDDTYYPLTSCRIFYKNFPSSFRMYIKHMRQYVIQLFLRTTHWHKLIT